MTEKLKSCPFCGGEARLKSSHGFNSVSCGNCGMEYPVSFDTRKKAAAVWNKRSIEDALQKELDEAREDNCENMEYHVAERERLKKEIVNLEAENKMLICALKAIKKIVDKQQM